MTNTEGIVAVLGVDPDPDRRLGRQHRRHIDLLVATAVLGVGGEER